MKVEFLKPGAGFGLGYHAGEEADLADEKALKLIEAGICIPSKEKAEKKETAESKASKEKAEKK